MGGDIEVGLAADRLDCPLERGVGERRMPAALLTDKMMVVLLGIDSLIAGGVAADLDAMHEMKPLKLLEGAVDARPPDRVEPPVDLQRRHRAGLYRKQLDHFPTCRSTAVSGLVEAPNRCLGPIHGRERIR